MPLTKEDTLNALKDLSFQLKTGVPPRLSTPSNPLDGDKVIDRAVELIEQQAKTLSDYRSYSMGAVKEQRRKDKDLETRFPKAVDEIVQDANRMA